MRIISFMFGAVFVCIILYLGLVGMVYLDGKQIQITQRTNTTLQQIVKQEVGQANLSNDSVCRHYAEYYYDLFTTKYPELDVKWIRKTKVAEDEYHTYVIVHGYNEYCVVDQQVWRCIQMKGGENNNEEK